MTDSDALVKHIQQIRGFLSVISADNFRDIALHISRQVDEIEAAAVKGAEGWQIGGVAIVSDKSVPQNAYEIWHSDGRKERFYISDNGQPLPAAPKEPE